MREIKNIQLAHPLVYERIEQIITEAYQAGVSAGFEDGYSEGVEDTLNNLPEQ